MRVRTSQKCFVDNTIRDAGDVFEYNGPKVEYFECLDQAGSDSEINGVESERRKPGRPRKVMNGSDQTA